MKKYNELLLILEGMRKDIYEFYARDNLAAGRRTRVKLMSIIKITGDMREEIQDLRYSVLDSRERARAAKS